MAEKHLESNRGYFKDAEVLLPEERNLYITRIEFLGNVVQMHWVDQQTNEVGYTEITYETYVKQFKR